MTDKDSNDMTASELLRATADSIREGVSSRGVRFSSADSIDEFREMLDVDSEPTYAEDMTSTLSVLADKIDAELSDARAEGIEASLRADAEIWAKANGWPDFKDGENFGEWLERCAIPRPRFDDEEPVQSSDMEEIGAMATYRVYMDGGWEFEPDKYEDETSPKPWDAQFGTRNDRVKRPAPEALGADGKPIVAGETVWGILSGIEGTVSSLNDDSTAYVEWDDERWSPCIDCCNLTHTPPDTQERIDEDKKKLMYEYWECKSSKCGECPATIDGKKPSLYYGVRSCSTAQGMDIARRQAELDARKGGAE